MVRTSKNDQVLTKEVAMAERAVPSYPVVEMVIGAIADWVKNYRYAIGLNEDLANCGPDEVKAIANDLGMTPADLRELASKGPGAADLLKQMLIALKVDPKALNEIDQRTARDLQRLCITCGMKRRCQHELAAGTAVKNMDEFCPNAVSLKGLFKSGALNPAQS
jgi:hypothetical protein